MRRLVLLFCVFNLFYVETLYLPSTESPHVSRTNEADVAEEVQNALCQISTKDLEATANATITRQLKGVCTSSQLESNFNQLQAWIFQEFTEIKYILQQNGFNIIIVNNNVFNVSGRYAEKSNKSQYQVLNSRQAEIEMYNDTLLETSEGNKYFYYWKIEDIRKLLKKFDLYKSSEAFSVFGHSLYLQLYPNYTQRGYFGIQLKASSSGFLKKHKIYIIHQLNSDLDIESGFLYGLKGQSMFFINEEQLSDQGFTQRQCMIIKLEIFLNS